MSRILYNTTFFGHKELASPFRKFITDVYLPASSAAGVSALVALSIRTCDNEEEGFRMAVQFVAEDDKALEAYCRNVGSALLNEVSQRWGHQILWMSSAMDVIE